MRTTQPLSLKPKFAGLSYVEQGKRLRPSASPEATYSTMQSMPQAAPSFGQPRPISRLVRDKGLLFSTLQPTSRCMQPSVFSPTALS